MTRQRPSPQNTQRPHAPSASNPQSESVSEAARIVAIQKSKQERSVQWQAKRKVFDSSIFELQRGIRRLEQEIKNLDSISAAEKAVEAQKNSWGTWLISPLYKTLEESEAEKARKDRQKQERRFEKDMKERRLDSKKVDLKAEEYQLRKTKEEIDAADLRDDEKIRMIQTKRQARENRESEERAKVEKELLARIQKQQQEEREKKERDALEAMRKRYQERVRKQQKADEANTHRGQYTHFDVNKGSTYEARTSACRHGGWWPKVQGRMACPECYESWTYLLQCPDCKVKACPRCQAAMRPRISRNRGTTNRRTSPRVMPDYDYNYFE